VVDATVAENVSLIRSIPEKYLGDVQTSVMQSVKAGRDLATLSKDLRKNYGVSYRRAALIARDQNNKATSALMRVRQVDLGLEKGVWLHSHAGKEPRPTHLANHGKKFDLKEGWFDPDPRVRKRILPGELINCRCVWKPVVPGLT
jgi:SPP1 gp7 family putative phage head morphogenesis protein